MDIRDAYDITAPLDAPGRRLKSAQHILMTEAASLDHDKLANMLRVCADALPVHPEPQALCRNNAGRLWAAMLAADKPDAVIKPGAPDAMQIHMASLAFDRAADALGIPAYTDADRGDF